MWSQAFFGHHLMQQCTSQFISFNSPSSLICNFLRSPIKLHTNFSIWHISKMIYTFDILSDGWRNQLCMLSVLISQPRYVAVHLLAFVPSKTIATVCSPWVYNNLRQSLISLANTWPEFLCCKKICNRKFPMSWDSTEEKH